MSVQNRLHKTQTHGKAFKTIGNTLFEGCLHRDFITKAEAMNNIFILVKYSYTGYANNPKTFHQVKDIVLL